MMKVCKKRCDQCLFDSKNRVVSAARAQDIFQDVVSNDTHFCCHKLARGEEVVCRGSYDFHKGQLVRIAHRLGAIEFVDPDTGEKE